MQQHYREPTVKFILSDGSSRIVPWVSLARFWLEQPLGATVGCFYLPQSDQPRDHRPAEQQQLVFRAPFRGGEGEQTIYLDRHTVMGILYGDEATGEPIDVVYLDPVRVVRAAGVAADDELKV